MVHVYFEQCVSKENISQQSIKDSSFFQANQVFGDEEMHATVRQNCMDYIVSLFIYFNQTITGFCF
jgi:signal-transduction protein with cAMP-binding, CBS, and nucleotidyltransferase domain